MPEDLDVAPELVIPGADWDWSAVRASGPGGQNVNRRATRVELRFDLAGTAALAPAVKARIRRTEGHRLDAEGKIIITSSEFRSQLRNLEAAKARLREIILAAVPEPKSRRPTKPSKASKRRRVQDKLRAGETKQGRRRIRADRD